MLYSRCVQVRFAYPHISASIHFDILTVHPRLTIEDCNQTRDNLMTLCAMPPTNEGR